MTPNAQPQTLLETLVVARELIASPAAWTQGEFARDAHGKPVHPRSETATCFCLLGALNRAGGDTLGAAGAMTEVMASSKYRRHFSLPIFNDSHKTDHEMVLDLIDQTIERTAGVAA